MFALKDKKIWIYFHLIASVSLYIFFPDTKMQPMFPVGFLLQFDTNPDSNIVLALKSMWARCESDLAWHWLLSGKVLRYESVFIIIINKIVLNSLIFGGWLFVTYGIGLVSIPRYYILVSYRSQNDGIEPSLLFTICWLKSRQYRQWEVSAKKYTWFWLLEELTLLQSF